MQTSTRRAIQYPDLTRGDRPDVPRDIYALLQALDVDVIYQQGTDAERGASGHQLQGGRLWWTTDTHILWYDDGNSWYQASGANLSGLLPFSIIDAKGDLIVGTGPDAASRFAVGTPGQIISADPGTPTGLSWVGREMATITQPASLSIPDAPTYVMNVVGVDLSGLIGPGSRITLMQSTQKWFVVTAPVVYSGGNSTVTMYGGTDFQLLASPGISGLAYSNTKSPPGMPMAAEKWTYVAEFAASLKINNPAQGVWVNPGVSFALPIGSWWVSYMAYLESDYSSPQGEVTDYATLSTTTNSETDKRWTSTIHEGTGDNSTNKLGSDVTRERPLTVSAKTTYNLLAKANDPSCSNIGFMAALGGTTILQARCAYL